MRLALLVVGMLCVGIASAQEPSDYEYFASPAVHDSLAHQIALRRSSQPDLGFYLVWRFYSRTERGVSLIALPAASCEQVRLRTSGRFMKVAGERLVLILEDDNWFGVQSWSSNPIDSTAARLPMRCAVMHEWPYTVRFDTRGQVVAAGRE